MPPPSNGLELSCPAEAGCPSLLYVTPAGNSSIPEGPARRVSFSELLGSQEGTIVGTQIALHARMIQ